MTQQVQRHRKMVGVTNARVRMRLSKEEMARRLGISGVSLGTWEHGLGTPTQKNLGKLMSFLGMTKISELYGHVGRSVDPAPVIIPEPEKPEFETGIVCVLENVVKTIETVIVEYKAQKAIDFEQLATEYQKERDDLKAQLATANESLEAFKNQMRTLRTLFATGYDEI